MFKPKDRQKKEIVKTHTGHSSNACMYMWFGIPDEENRKNGVEQYLK